MKPAPQTGHPIPHFHAQDSKGEEFSSEGLLGRPYILYFYPKDDSPGCTAEACSLRDNKAQFDKLDALIIGISPDSAESHHQFIAKHNLNFHLIPDPSHELCSLFDVWQEKNVNGQMKWGVVRATFLVDSKGMIRWMEKPVQVEGHTERVMQALQNISKASSAL